MPLGVDHFGTPVEILVEDDSDFTFDAVRRWSHFAAMRRYPCASGDFTFDAVRRWSLAGEVGISEAEAGGDFTFDAVRRWSRWTHEITKDYVLVILPLMPLGVDHTYL